MDKDTMQMLGLLKTLGIDLNPLSQASNLVNLINASQEPDRRQDMFEREMALKQTEADRMNAFRQQQLAQTSDHFNRSHDLRQQGYESQNQRYREASLLGLVNPLLATHGIGMDPMPQMNTILQMLGLSPLQGQKSSQSEPNPSPSREIQDQEMIESLNRLGYGDHWQQMGGIGTPIPR